MLQGTQGQQRLSRKQPQLNCVKRKRSQKLEAIEQPVWRHWGAFGHRLRTWSMWWCRQRRTSARIPCRYWYWYWCWCWYWHAQREDESGRGRGEGGEQKSRANATTLPRGYSTFKAIPKYIKHNSRLAATPPLNLPIQFSPTMVMIPRSQSSTHMGRSLGRGLVGAANMLLLLHEKQLRD